MKLGSIPLLLAVVLLWFGAGAQAGPCNAPVLVYSPGFSATYTPANPTSIITSTTMTGACTKIGGNTATYTVAADSGLNFSGTNRAAFAGNFINYFVSTSPTCGNTWNAANPISFAFSSSGSLSPTYYGCIPSGQYVPAGTYTDTVTMTASIGGTGTFPVSITINPECTISTTPGPVAFSYIAFGGAVSANTTFGVRCTISHPYTMALDATSGVVSGLTYSLGLNTTGSGGTGSLGSAGTGLEQTFYINGTMAAGQAGTCSSSSCLGTDPRTLTITY